MVSAGSAAAVIGIFEGRSGLKISLVVFFFDDEIVLCYNSSSQLDSLPSLGRRLFAYY